MLFYFFAASVPSSAQSWKWAKGSSVVDGYCESWSVALDPSGNVYSAGYTESLTGGLPGLQSNYGSLAVVDSYGVNEQGVLVSTDSNGNYRWAIGTQGGTACLFYVVCDPYGFLYVTGYDSSGSFQFGSQSYSTVGPFCAKVDASGNVLWIKNLAPGTQGYGILTSSSSNIYAYGSFTGNAFTLGSTTLTNNDVTGLTSDAFYAKYDSSGNPIWAKSFGGSLTDEIYVAALTKDSELYLAGPYYSSAITIGSTTLTAPDSGSLYIAKFSEAGNAIWAKKIAANDSLDGFNGITVDPDYNVYLTGIYWHTITIGTYTLPTPAYANMFLAKYDSSGNAKWAQAQTHISDCFGVAADPCGNLWVCGSAQTLSNPPTVSDTLYLAEYDTSGVLENIITVNSGGDDNSGILVDNKGNLYVGGDYLSYLPLTVGTDMLTFSDTTEEAMFILKYNYEPGGECLHDTLSAPLFTKSPVPLAVGGASLYPNPARTEIRLSAPYTIDKVAIVDLMGRTMVQQDCGTPQANVNVSSLPAGVYFVKINGPSTGSGQATETLRFLKE